MFETKITKMFGIKHPIIGGAMMWLSTPELVAAVSEAGGLGIMASAMYETKQQLADAIDRVRELTDKPFGVNINLFPSMRPIKNDDYIDVLIDKNINIIETSGHSAPVDLCRRFRDAGAIWMHKCVGIRYALKVQELGADIVTVVGYENGGATGKLDIGTLVLIPTAVDALRIPVIGGGGVSDGRGFASLLALGAEGIIIGTRLLTTKECPIHEKLKNALIKATELDTMLVMRSINATHRVFANSAAKRCVELEKDGAKLPEILDIVAGEKAKRMFEKGDLEAGVISCGQGVGLSHDILTVKELFDKIIGQAKDVLKKIVID